MATEPTVPVPNRAGGRATRTHGPPDYDTRPVWVVGELDLKTAPELLRHLRAILENRPDGPVVLDLSRVSFMDVAGVHLMLEVRTRLAARGLELMLRAVPPCVNVVLAMTGCEDVFATAPGLRRAGQRGCPQRAEHNA